MQTSIRLYSDQSNRFRALLEWVNTQVLSAAAHSRQTWTNMNGGDEWTRKSVVFLDKLTTGTYQCIVARSTFMPNQAAVLIPISNFYHPPPADAILAGVEGLLLSTSFVVIYRCCEYWDSFFGFTCDADRFMLEMGTKPIATKWCRYTFSYDASNDIRARWKMLNFFCGNSRVVWRD